MSQLALPLAWPTESNDGGFLIGQSNADAVRLLGDPSVWPVRTAILTGPQRSGRSLLSRVFASRTGATVIDDAAHVAEEALFHAWSRAEADGRPLLLVADARPPAWTVRLPDLRSRLAASPVAMIDAPDDELARALLDRVFTRAGLDARPDLIDWLAARTERSHAALLDTADALVTAAMEQRRRLSIPFARGVVSGYGAPDTPDVAPDTTGTP